MIKIITIIIASCSMTTINSMNIPLQPPPPAKKTTITEQERKQYRDMQKTQGDAAARKAMFTKFEMSVIYATLGNPPPAPSPRPGSPKKLADSPVSAALATLRDSLDAVNTNVSSLAQQLNALRTKITSDATSVEDAAEADQNRKPIGSTSIKPNNSSLLLEQIQKFNKSTIILPPEKIIAQPDESIVEESSTKIPSKKDFAQKLAAQREKLKKIETQPNESLVTEGPSSALANSEQEEENIAPSSSITQQAISEKDKAALRAYETIQELRTKNETLYNKLITLGHTDKTIEPFLFTEVADDEW